MFWTECAKRILEGSRVSKAEALSILNTDDDDLLEVLHAAFVLRRYYFGRSVTIHVIQNARSCACSEDCAFCSQAGGALTDAPLYRLQKVDELVRGAHEAHRLKAMRYCIVTSGKAPDAKDIDVLCRAARQIKSEVPIQICASLGLLDAGQARALKAAGVDRFNHNLESSERFYPVICSTHDYAARRQTAQIVKASGMELCSGGLIGMGEALEDRVELAFALGDVAADSIPLNFLDPRPGTALEHLTCLTPADCLRALAMFRFVHPDREIRMAGGREACLGSMQVLALYAANSIFTKGYLTTPGQGYHEDMEMIEKAGFSVTDWTAA